MHGAERSEPKIFQIDIEMLKMCALLRLYMTRSPWSIVIFFFQENLITISTSNNKVQNWNICQSFQILIIESNKDKVYHAKMFYCDASKKWAQSTVYTVDIKKSQRNRTQEAWKVFLWAILQGYKICCRAKRGEFFFNYHIEIVNTWAILRR